MSISKLSQESNLKTATDSQAFSIQIELTVASSDKFDLKRKFHRRETSSKCQNNGFDFSSFASFEISCQRRRWRQFGRCQFVCYHVFSVFFANFALQFFSCIILHIFAIRDAHFETHYSKTDVYFAVRRLGDERDFQRSERDQNESKCAEIN